LTISLTEGIKTVPEVKKNLRSIFQQIHQTGRPVVVTVKGKPDVVIVDDALLERKRGTTGPSSA